MKSLSAEEKKKRNLIVAGILVVVSILFWVVLDTSPDVKKDTDAPDIKIIDDEATLEDSFRQRYGTELEQIKKDLDDIDNQSKAFIEENRLLQEQNLALQTAKLLEEDNSTDDLSDDESYTFPPATDYDKNTEFNSNNINQGIPPVVTVMTGLISVGSPISSTSSTDEISNTSNSNKASKNDLIIPTASFMRGELLSGVTAPTMGKGTSDPVPAIIRVTDLARLPNFYRADITECFILVESKGSLATEMVSMRLKTLSCKDVNGKTIERNIDGYVTGENGMEGLRGRVVSKQATILGRTFIASFMSGLAEAFGESTQSVITSPSGTLTTVNPGDALESGLWSGAAGATNRLAEFYMDLANEMVPVIEINAGRKVDIIFLKSVNLSSSTSKEIN